MHIGCKVHAIATSGLRPKLDLFNKDSSNESEGLGTIPQSGLRIFSRAAVSAASAR